MKKVGVKIVYKLSEISGLRNTIEYEIGDMVWVYSICESYRKENKEIEFDRRVARIIDVAKSDDGLHYPQYGVEYLDTNGRAHWFYPTFLEPYEYKTKN